MAAVSEQRLFDALATVARAFAHGGVPAMPGADAASPSAPSRRTAATAGRSGP